MTAKACAALLAVCASIGAGARVGAAPAAVTVRMHISFDQSIRPEAIKSTARDEGGGLWKDYGVELVGVEEGAARGLCLDAVVEGDSRRLDPAGPPAVLGETKLADGILQ